MSPTPTPRFDLSQHHQRGAQIAASESDQLARLLWLNALFGSVNGSKKEDDESLEPLVARMGEYTLSAGTLLFSAGEQAAALYFVQSGEIKFGDTGYQHFTSGDVLGFTDCAIGQTHKASATVVKEAQILVLSRSDWLDYLEMHPVAVRNLIRAGIPALSVQPHPLDAPKAFPAALNADNEERETSTQFVQRLLALRAHLLFEKSGIQALSQLVRGAKKLYLEAGEQFQGTLNEPLVCMLVTGQCKASLAVAQHPPSEHHFNQGHIIGSIAGFYEGFTEFKLVAQSSLELMLFDPNEILAIAEDHFDLTLSLVAYSAQRIKAVMQAGGIQKHLEEKESQRFEAELERDKRTRS